MSFIDEIKNRAKKDTKKIVLPESEDDRTLRATSEVLKQKFAEIILVGNKEKILKRANELNLENVEEAEIIDPVNSDKYDEFVEKFYELRKNKGMTIEKAKEYMLDNSGLNENPDSEALSEIAISSSKSFDLLVGKEPKIAMLSYSSHGSAKSDLTEKVINATNLVKEKAPELLVDGELQLDAAIIPEVAEYKAKGSPLKGKANVLIFPDLNSGNIGYKLVQRLAKAEAYGPLCQGIAKPVNDLSRGCNSKDIEGVIAITAVQAQEQEK